MTIIIRCMDVETTGLDPTKDAVVEVGWCDVTEDSGLWRVGPAPNSILVKPPIRIPPAASAIHHIIDEDVANAPPLLDVLPDLLLEGGIYAAHRAAFEQLFLRGFEPWICTWKLAVTMAPSAPGHSLQEMRYWSHLNVDRRLADQSHRAGPDAYVCAVLLARMLSSGKMTVEQMVALSAGPVVLPKLHFGKWAGVPVKDVEPSYWEWCLKQDMEPDVLHTARTMLGRTA